MSEVLTAIAAAVSFEGFMRTLELLVLVYMLRVIYEVKHKTDMLYKWHDQDDPNFPERKIWWSDPTISVALATIAENGTVTNKLLRELQLNMPRVG